MIDSIFYNGEEILSEREIDITGLIKSLSENSPIKKKASTKDFLKGEELLRIVFLEEKPAFICRAIEGSLKSINNITHKYMVERFGEIIEVFDRPSLENISELFPSNAYPDDIISFIDSDYSSKSGQGIDVRGLSYLGQESDGKFYLYDEGGTIYVYACDHLIEENDLSTIDGQPDDTFFKSKKFNRVEDIAKAILMEVCE